MVETCEVERNVFPCWVSCASYVLGNCRHGKLGGQVVPKLLHFLKEYYMRGQEKEVLGLFQDMDAGRFNVVREEFSVGPEHRQAALRAFQAWKNEGCIGLPVVYHSTQYKPRECFVAKLKVSGVELTKFPVGSPKLDAYQAEGKNPVSHAEADWAKVVQREGKGWFVPDPPEVDQDWQEYTDPETGRSWWWNERTKSYSFDPPPRWRGCPTPTGAER
ncbi:unnamed protein product [Durusdinium trenchii]|uniref:WW domain-containing protein n=1 Tax=Durusdinium trenchii TaxID=1381693 RepID=A0ABP0S234_9DINO